MLPASIPHQLGIISYLAYCNSFESRSFVTAIAFGAVLNWRAKAPLHVHINGDSREIRAGLAFRYL